jgi:hypothetical protein
MTMTDRLVSLVRAGLRFRKTPIVDDDFPAMRDEFDRQLDAAEEACKRPRPRVVCLCGSTKFMEAWQAANLSETLAGRIVLSIGCNTKSDADLQRMGELTAEKKAELDELHKRKIDLADECLFLNVGGYIGTSTRSELEYARRLGRPVRWLEPDKAV